MTEVTYNENQVRKLQKRINKANRRIARNKGVVKERKVIEQCESAVEAIKTGRY